MGGGWGSGVSGRGRVGGGGGQGGCERRIEVFVKIQKKKIWGGGPVGGGGGSVAEGVRWGGWGWWGGGQGGCDTMLGVGVMWGMGDVNQE